MPRKLRPLARRNAYRGFLTAAAVAALLTAATPTQAAPFAYVTNSNSGSVSQYDSSPGGLLSPLSPPTVAAGSGTSAVAVGPDGQSVYVINEGSNTVSQYSVGADGTLSPKSPPTVAAGSPGSYVGWPGAGHLAVAPDGQSVYVAYIGNPYGAGGLLQYSVKADGTLSPKSPALALCCENPVGVAVSPDGQSVYVTSPHSHSILQYDVGAGGKLSPKSPTRVAAGDYPFEVAVSPDGQSVYVTDWAVTCGPHGECSPAILQYDVGSGGKLSPKTPATVGTDSPWGIAVSPDAKSVYVVNTDSSTVSQYDVGPDGAVSPKSPATVAAGSYPFGVAVDQDGQSVYVTDGDGVLQYDVGSGGKLSPKSPATVATEGGRFGVAVSPPLDHPLTTITGGPVAVTNDPTPSFTFSSSAPGSTFQCKLDSSAYSACNPPKTTAHLADGRHTFYVRAKDLGGTVDPTPALRAFTVDTAEVAVSGSTLTVTAATGAKDNLQVTKPTASTLRVTDLASGSYAGSGVHTAAGCTRSGDYTASCSAAGVTLIRVLAADQADQVTNSTSVQSALNGGPADDTLTGGFAKDTLTGAAGADVMRGMNGNDVLMARDLTSDQTINCDGGGTSGSADKADLDLLPLDPNSKVTGCETKTRH